MIGECGVRSFLADQGYVKHVIHSFSVESLKIGLWICQERQMEGLLGLKSAKAHGGKLQTTGDVMIGSASLSSSYLGLFSFK